LGEKSFGKGSVQELVDLPGGSAVKVTVAKWITPGGVNLNHNGLEPDIVVKLTEEDINAKKDPQMDKALEEITK
jgi:carboxyl-terminal processing protease